ncbi:uncharacterized protein LOC144817798 [Lissotriton helveticus]
MGSTQLFSFLLTVIAGTVFPGHILSATPVTEKSYEQTVLPSFVDGLNSLMSVAETLQSSTDLEQGIQNVRQHLEASEKSLSKAEESSLAQVKSLNENMEERLDKMNRLNDEQKALQAREEGLKVQLEGEQGQEHTIKRQLEEAKAALRDADYDLERAIRAWHSAEDDRKVGLGLVFIPIVGSITGGIMIAKADAAIRDAINRANEAKRLKQIHKAAVDKFESELQYYEESIRSTKRAISANTEHIQDLQRDLNSEKTLYQKLNKFLIPLRKCTSLLSILAGKTSAASMYVEFSGTLDGLLVVLDEIIVTLRPLVESSQEYSPLITAKLPTIIHKLTVANSRLKKAATG